MSFILLYVFLFQGQNQGVETKEFSSARDPILVLTLDEKTDEAFGDFYESNKHSKKIGELLLKLKKAPPKSLGIDLLLGGNAQLDQARSDFFSQIESINFPIVLGLALPSPDALISDANQPSFLSYGHCFSERTLKTKHSQGHLHTEATDQYKLSSRSLIESSLPYQMIQDDTKKSLPAEFKSIRIDLKDESKFKKISLQEALQMNEEELRANFEGKYILIGSDYEQIDIKSSGVNGVFYLAEALRTYLQQKE